MGPVLLDWRTTLPLATVARWCAGASNIDKRRDDARNLGLGNRLLEQRSAQDAVACLARRCGGAEPQVGRIHRVEQVVADFQHLAPCVDPRKSRS